MTFERIADIQLHPVLDSHKGDKLLVAGRSGVLYVLPITTLLPLTGS